MGDTTSDIFQLTMAGIERGFDVSHIATLNVHTCRLDEDAAQVLANHPDFDQIPVVDDGRIVGVLERDGAQSNWRVKERYRPLDDRILIAASTPMIEFVRLMQTPPYYRLVLRGTRIDGLATRSDLLKLPVRIYAFTLVTHLEALMAAVIRTRCPEEATWLRWLRPARREGIERRAATLAGERSNPDKLELTTLVDKWEIVKEVTPIKRELTDSYQEIENLRNALAHGRNYGDSSERLGVFLARLEQTTSWIAVFGDLVGRITPSDPVDTPVAGGAERSTNGGAR